MRRFGAIASLLLVAAIGVGAFVYAGSDTSAGRKSTATVVKEESANSSNTSTVTTVKKADSQPVTSNSVASASPTPKPSSDDNVFHVGDDAKPELDGYEAREVFVGLSPSVVVPGKTIEISVRGFHRNEPVVISIDPAPAVGGGRNDKAAVVPSTGLVINTDPRGRGKLKVTITQAPGRWIVTALGTVTDSSGAKRSSAAFLKVVLKK